MRELDTSKTIQLIYINKPYLTFSVFSVRCIGRSFLELLAFITFFQVLVTYTAVFIRTVFYVMVGKKLHNICSFLLSLLSIHDGYNENEILKTAEMILG